MVEWECVDSGGLPAYTAYSAYSAYVQGYIFNYVYCQATIHARDAHGSMRHGLLCGCQPWAMSLNGLGKSFFGLVIA